MQTMWVSAEVDAAAAARAHVPSVSPRRLRLIGAAIGLLVGAAPFLIEPSIRGSEARVGDFGPFLALGFGVGPLTGFALGHEIRPDRLRIGLAARMALLAVVLGDAVFVLGSGLGEWMGRAGIGSIVELIGGLVAIFVLGLVIVGPFALLLTSVCAVVWQGLMIGLVRGVEAIR